MILWLWMGLHAYSQSVTFVVEGSEESIPGVVVKVRSLSADEWVGQVTNDQGRLVISEEFPLVIETSHLSYETLIDTLFTRKEYRIPLVPSINQLDEVVVTGQFSPQSIRNSVFRVQAINSEEIQSRGSNTLQEALASQLNIRLSQDLALGSATISLQGISSQNVKILVDGVPLVNRVGNGNGADLSQINLQNIERIELVEGPMAVNYGANALAGVLNLITKKDFINKTEVQLSAQTESAGSEYGLDRGRHIQSFNLNHRLNSQWSLLVGAQHNDFLGYQGGAALRQHEWNPKEQWSGNALIKFEDQTNSFHYRLDAFDELIQDFGTLQNNFLPSGENQPFAIDETYDSKRMSHQIQAEGKLSFLDRYSAFVSYSDFERQKRRFSKNVVTGIENLTTGAGDQDLSTYRVWEFGGTGYLNSGESLAIQTGYQISLETVGGGRILDEEQSIQEYGIYGALEWNPVEKFTIRPGVRYTNNSAFGDQLIPSVQLKYNLSRSTQFRASYGKGFRSPSVRELYFEFVDSNHRIFGNPDLLPEKSNHFSVNARSDYTINGLRIQGDLNLFFNDIENQIGIGQNINDVTSTTYLNISRFKTLGATFSQKATIGNWSGSLGFSYIGRFNRISETEENLSQFFYSPELSSNITYTFPGKATSVNFFYKYAGRIQSYFTEINTQNEEVISIGEVAGYHWMDATITHSFGERFNATLGARNLFNIRRINNSGLSGGAHSGGPSVPVSYGRSYLLKLSYNLNFK